MNNQKPWTDENGKALSQSVLKAKCQSWSAETWEEYLTATVDRECNEIEAIANDYFEVLDLETETLWNRHSSLPQAVEGSVRRSVDKLEPMPKKVIRGFYWLELSGVRIAKELKVTQQSVSRAKKRSLGKIKDLLESEVVVASYLIGGSAKLATPHTSKNDDIAEVYKLDLKGSYLK